MEKAKANVVHEDNKVFIQIAMEHQVIRIPVSEDRPLEVKGAFNQLVTVLKTSLFQIELEEEGADLFSHVAKEYLQQLNQELKEVHGTMTEYGLGGPDAAI